MEFYILDLEKSCEFVWDKFGFIWATNKSTFVDT